MSDNEIRSLFSKINEDCSYIVLRNFEGFFDDILLPGHEDIDFLCGSSKDRDKIIKAFQAVTRAGYDDGYHYFWDYNGIKITLDLRIVGDGYYDKKWQKNMLKSRKYDDRGFFVPDDENYYYSLIYHALYQKEAFPEDYFQKLKLLKPTSNSSASDYENDLIDFMVKNDYYCYQTKDISVIRNFDSLFSKSRVKNPIGIRLGQKKIEFNKLVYDVKRADAQGKKLSFKALIAAVAYFILGEKNYSRIIKTNTRD